MTPGTAPEGADELAKLKSACRTLGKIVVGQHRAMEAARIEMTQGSTHKAMQWILNSLPDQWDDEETKWDGKESANEWWDRTDGFYREATSEEKAPAIPPAPVAAPLDPVEELRRIADQDIGANAPWLADKLHAFADQLAAEMRGECQMDAPAAVFDREAAGRIVHDTRLACEAERAALEGRKKFHLEPWERRTYEQQETDMRIAEAVSAAVRDGSEEKAKLAAVAAYLEERKGDAGLSLMHVWDLWAIIGAGKGASRE
jgi:hypothetical protein